MDIALRISVTDRDNWVTAEVEDKAGNILGQDTAPIVEGATFDAQGAVIKSAVERAVRHLQVKKGD